MNCVNHLDLFRNKIAEGKLCLGTGITFIDPAISELVGEVGFDFTWIDMEHGPYGLQTALNHVTAVRGTGTAPFVRVPYNHVDEIKRVLDLAPAAVVVPNVKSPEEAERAVAACRYPPRGVRGYGPRRGQRYGMVSQADFLAQVEDEPLVILQIEHIDAVNCIDQIVAIPGIDSICVGPNDLSGSMGKLGEVHDPDVSAAMDTIANHTRSAGLLLGTSTFYSEENFARWLERGAHWMGLSVDWAHLCTALRDLLTTARDHPSAS